MIYFDNAATSFPKAPGVAEAVSEALCSPMGNSGRSSHVSSLKASRLLYETRKLAADYFSHPAPERVIFTSGATESLNTAIFGMITKDANILTTMMEHNAVARPLRNLFNHAGMSLVHIHSDNFGYIDLKAFEVLVTEGKFNLVVINGESNVTGTIQPLDRMIELLEARGIPYIIDGAQLTGDVKVDLSGMHRGCYCCSGHKGLLSPAGIGLLILGDACSIDPLLLGGTGSKSDSDIQPDFLPDALESGTRNIHGIAGLRASLSYLLSRADAFRIKHEINEYLFSRLEAIEGIILHSPAEHRGSVISFTCEGYEIDEVTEFLDEEGIACRMGMHCAPWAHNHIGTAEGGGTIRISTGLFTTRDEIDQFISLLGGYLHG